MGMPSSSPDPGSPDPRIAGEPGLDREYAPGEIAVAVRNGSKAGFGAECRPATLPGTPAARQRPSSGRSRGGSERRAGNRTAIFRPGASIAALKGRAAPEGRRVGKVADFPRLLTATVDCGISSEAHEAGVRRHRPAARWRGAREPLLGRYRQEQPGPARTSVLSSCLTRPDRCCCRSPRPSRPGAVYQVSRDVRAPAAAGRNLGLIGRLGQDQPRQCGWEVGCGRDGGAGGTAVRAGMTRRWARMPIDHRWV
jgi:hypothetical protein